MKLVKVIIGCFIISMLWGCDKVQEIVPQGDTGDIVYQNDEKFNKIAMKKIEKMPKIPKMDMSKNKTTVVTKPTAAKPVARATVKYYSFPRGVLWKPTSENTGRLAILLSPSYGAPSVSVWTMQGKLIMSGSYSGRSNPDRATYRFSKAGRQMPNPCLLRIGSKFYLVSNPASRHE